MNKPPEEHSRELSEIGPAQAFFLGRLPSSLLLPYPRMSREEEEVMESFRETLKAFLDRHVDPKAIDRTKTIPAEVIRGLFELGVMGLTIPEAYGGLGMSHTAFCKVTEQISGHCASTAVLLGAHQSIGYKPLLLMGSEEQKRKYLSQFASGKLAAFSLSEPMAGSDPGSLRTTATLAPEGTHFILNGSKLWTSNGGIADYYTVFARTDEGLSALMVPRGSEGLSVGKEEEKMGIRGSSTTALFFENVRVPKENLIGPPGEGFKLAMEVLNYGRISLAAGCVGGAKKAIETILPYTKQRVQFERPIAEFEMIQGKIAEMMMETYAAESMTYLVAGLADQGKPFATEAAISKVFASEALWRVVDHAVQIAGGIGFSGDFPYERMLRDARINLIFEGTNEILRMYVALIGLRTLGQSLKRNGPIGFIRGRFLSQFLPLRFEGASPELREEVALLQNGIRFLHRESVRALLKHREAIREREYIQERLSNIAIDLFAMAACIARTTDLIQRQKDAQNALLLTRMFCRRSAERMNRHTRDLGANDDASLSEIAKRSLKEAKYPL